jgi:glycosyltransferase involved in cell wall biosynthesis
MPESPQASVIINNYNYGRFVGEAIESALQQSYPHTQVIVVDDGSTDESRDVIGNFGKRVVPVFKANGGQGSAYNAGFAASCGDIISFLDSDDTLLPQAVENAVQLMEDESIVKVQWPLNITDATGNLSGKLSTIATPPEGDLRESVTRDGPFYDWFFTTGAAYRRRMLDHVMPMPAGSYRIGGDEYLISLAPIFGKIRNTAEPLATYRCHSGNYYHGAPLNDERIYAYLQRWEASAAMLQAELEKQGVCVSLESWKGRNFNYLWLHRIVLAKCDIESLVPPGHSFILVDEDEWGSELEVPQRKRIPFLERGGTYWGPPADCETAIDELERLRLRGAEYIVFWWTAGWWLEHYHKFHEYLCDRFRCCLANDRLTAFDLRR